MSIAACHLEVVLAADFDEDVAKAAYEENVEHVNQAPKSDLNDPNLMELFHVCFVFNLMCLDRP